MKKLLTTLSLAILAGVAYGQGTVQFVNGAASRISYTNGPGSGVGGFTTAAQAVHMGIFVGPDAMSLRLAPESPKANSSATAGLFATSPVALGTLYPIAGFDTGTRPFAQIRVWSIAQGDDWAAAMMDLGSYFGQTDVRQLDALGTPGGPGTVIWQGATGTVATRFRPFTIAPGVPEPSTWALGAIGVGALWLLRRRKAS